LVLGHRGASAICPENSLEAFARAIADGADGVELDVICCSTGEVMVFHDDDLARLGGRPERIRDLPYSELRDLALASGARIPTLPEALAVCQAPCLVNVELKAAGFWGGPLGALADRVATAIERAGAVERVLVSSFHPRAIAVWQRRSPGVPAGLLFERGGPLILRHPWAVPVLRPLGVHPESVLCDAERVADWHRAGHLVNVWTVDDPATLGALATMGVDGVITNDPAAARAVLGSIATG
jgi:glycerophosphoryl diester phosphodiesterase